MNQYPTMLCYSDFDWASEQDSRQSISANCTMLCGVPSPGWASGSHWLLCHPLRWSIPPSRQHLKKWCMIVTSLSSVGFPQNQPTVIKLDNQSVLALAKKCVKYSIWSTKERNPLNHFREVLRNDIVAKKITLFQTDDEQFLKEQQRVSQSQQFLIKIMNLYTNWFKLNLWGTIHVAMRKYEVFSLGLHYLKLIRRKASCNTGTCEKFTKGSLYEWFTPRGELKENHKHFIIKQIRSYFFTKLYNRETQHYVFCLINQK